MKKISRLLLFVLVCHFASAQAQETKNSTNALYYLIQDKLKTENFVKATNLFSASPSTEEKKAKISQGLTKFLMVNLDVRNLKNLYSNNYQTIEMVIPTADGNLILELTQQRNLTDNFCVKASGTGEVVPYQPGLYYRGIVKGNANSLAAISVFENEIIGMVSTDDGNYVIGKMDGKGFASNEYIIYNDFDLKKENPFVCGADDDGPMGLPSTPDADPADALPSYASTCKTVKVYIEADSLLYFNKGSVLLTTNYVTGFFNIVATLYQRDSLFTEISQIKVWTTKEPYRSNTSINGLNDFGMRVRDTFPGDIAHLVSLAGGDAGVGGVAWLDVLCTSYSASGSTYYSRTAYSGIASTYVATLPIPVYSWTVQVFTHEMGHNLSSHHTHWCGWQLRPGKYGSVDSCYTRELYLGGCDTSGPIPSVSVKGTIMSYCHLTASGIKFANGFGILPGNAIRAKVKSAACLGNSCYCTDWVSLGANRSICDSIKLDAGTTFDSTRWSSGLTSRYLTVKTTGSYWLKMSEGSCASYDTVVLTVNTTSRRTLTQSICSGSSYLFNGVYRTTAGTYKDTLVNVKGCDSIVTLVLSIKPSSSRTINQNICSGSSYLFNGINRTTTGVYLDTFLNYVSCDSIVTLNLNVKASSASSISQIICTGSSVLFNGVLRTSSGVFKDTLVNYLSCDSIITLNLTVSSTLTSSINRNICGGNSVLFNGIPRTATGTYLDTLISFAGCDSIVTLNLLVKPTSSSSLTQTICNGDSYLFNGVNRTTSGTYLDTFINYIGCDSIVTLNLTVQTVNVAITQVTSTLSATLAGAGYQWINCNNGNAAIGGEINRSYTPSSNGSYAVVITEAGCRDTSACIDITNVGLSDNGSTSMIAIYPNPAKQSFILMSTDKNVHHLEVYNGIGELVLKREVSNGQETIDISKLAAAMYVVKVKDKSDEVLFQEKLNVIR